MWFIDKLNIHQDHLEPLPIIGSEMVIRVDLQTGEQLSESPKSKLLEGSYSSKIEIRCNGRRVSIRGNPSRWHRVDNLFGFTTIAQCIVVYNQLLRQYGIPQFTPSTNFWYRQGEEGSKVQLVSDGAVIDHIDFTRNFSVSSGREVTFLRGLSSFSMGKGKEPYLYPNGCTVDWYKGSTVQYKKVYKKAFDLITHKSKRLKNTTDKDKSYYQKLIDFCNDLGILREEHSFKRPWLKKKNLCFFGRTSESDFLPYLNDIENAMKRLQVMKLDYETIAEQLIQTQVVNSPQSANATQAVAHKWLHGCILQKNSQFYVHKARLIQLGIDISIPHDITKMPPQIRSNTLIEVSFVSPPDWYRMPKTHSLGLVA
ncbi:hypothetical protein IMCC1989_736 [gamma proteobacterium IMCC1989]|nr:hypothetical protein IMCC1989_736 [gamma proteobacterium IMCC1989]